MAFLHLVRVAALVSSCVAFVSCIGGLEGKVGRWCVFCWAFSFTGSLLILLVEMINLQQCVRNIWGNVPVTFCSYAALFCLTTSIIFPDYFIKGKESNSVYSYRVVAGFCSCLATLAHLVEVWIMWVTSICHMTTGQGLLQVCQTYVACAIFFIITNPVSYTDHAALIWCMAVYCICFVCTFISILSCACCNIRNRVWLKSFNLGAAILYLSTIIIWPVFKFNSHSLSQIYQSGLCQEGLGLCPETRLIVVAVLNGLNFLLYSLGVCCCCMSHSEEDEAQHNTSSSNSVVETHRPTQLSNETQVVIQPNMSRWLRIDQHNETNYNQILSRQDSGIHHNLYNYGTVDIFVKK